MSRRAAPGGGPRTPPGPRVGSGHRGPGTPRRARRPGRAAHGAIEARVADDAWPAPALEPRLVDARDARAAVEHVPASPPRGRSGGLSGLRLLLDHLDALLRDPTLTRALKAFADRVSEGVRDAAAATADATRRLLRALANLRLPRRLLLGLLALLLPLALLALLLGGGDRDKHSSKTAAADRPTQASGALAAAGMPALLSGQEIPAPLNVALVVDGSYDAAALRHELSALATWISSHHAPGTRVSVIDAGSASATAPLRASQLAGAVPTRPRASTAAAIRSALGSGRRRLLVTVGSAQPTPARTSSLTVAGRRGATATQRLGLKRGGHARVAIDERRPDALAASVARAMMALSGQRERR